MKPITAQEIGLVVIALHQTKETVHRFEPGLTDFHLETKKAFSKALEGITNKKQIIPLEQIGLDYVSYTYFLLHSYLAQFANRKKERVYVSLKQVMVKMGEWMEEVGYGHVRRSEDHLSSEEGNTEY